MRYLAMAMRTPQFQQSAIEPHKQFLARLKDQGLLELAGPFTDQSGGAYLIRASDLEEALSIAHQDPVHTSGSSVVTVHEWAAA